jgi:hypothetical protein
MNWFPVPRDGILLPQSPRLSSWSGVAESWRPVSTRTIASTVTRSYGSPPPRADRTGRLCGRQHLRC